MFPFKDRNPTESFPLVTLALIALNVAVYFLFQDGTLTLGDPSSRAYVCNLLEYAGVPREYTDPSYDLPSCTQDPASAVVTPLTSMFMHGGLFHLFGNMLFLWVFGNNVEDRLGRGRFLAFYLLGGLAALALQVAIDPNAETPVVGASGAISAVLAGYLLLFPRARVWTLVIIVPLPLPAVVPLVYWFVQQLFNGYAGLTEVTAGAGESGGVAYFAHIGGFVFGLLAVRAFARRRPEPATGLGL